VTEGRPATSPADQAAPGAGADVRKPDEPHPALVPGPGAPALVLGRVRLERPRGAGRPIELAYDVQGEGAPLVLIMGVGAQRIFWDLRLCARLVAAGFQVIRFDHRDLGESTRLDELPAPRPLRALGRFVFGLPVAAPYDLSDMAADVIGLCDHLGVARAHVAGVSMGGMVAQHMAIEHPARVASLASVMSTTGARSLGFRAQPGAVRALLAPPPRSAEAAGRHLADLFTTVGGGVLPTDRAALEAMGRAAYERGMSTRGFARHFAAIMKSGDRTKRLAAVRAPTLVFHGARDPLISVVAGRATARAIPGATLAIEPDMGHHLPRAVWDRLVAAIATNAARA
jgi:pimeloyl-ACP methyl ester carboxylesterase